MQRRATRWRRPILAAPGRGFAAWRGGRRRSVWMLAGAIVALGALFGGLLGAGAFDSRSASPSKWDARLGAIPATVERLRGLKFQHAVPVRFLNDADFKKEVGVDPKLGAAKRRELQHVAVGLRAAGLIAGEVDLVQAINAEEKASVLAFYSPDTKEVVVRATGVLDPAHRVTLAHELTHVLQDQYFDLNAMRARVERSSESSSDAFTAFVEGDAVRIENRYIDTLSAADGTAYNQGRDREAAAARQEMAAVPAIIDLVFSAPYRYGPPALSVVAANGGNANVDRAFRHSVFTQRLFIEPSAALTDALPRRTADPKLQAGEKGAGKVETLGAFDLYLQLASRIDPGVALRAAANWAGGRTRQFSSGGRTCVRSVFESASASAGNALAVDFSLWAGSLPAGMAQVGRRGKGVVVTSCDPGAGAALESPDVAIVRGGVLLDIHSELEAALTADAASAGAPISSARCFALEISQSPQIAMLIRQPEASITSETAQAAVREAGANARAHCLQ